MASIKEEVGTTSNQVANLDIKVNDLDVKVRQSQVDIKALEGNFKDVVSCSELDEIQRRKRNLCIHGLKEVDAALPLDERKALEHAQVDELLKVFPSSTARMGPRGLM